MKPSNGQSGLEPMGRGLTAGAALITICVLTLALAAAGPPPAGAAPIGGTSTSAGPAQVTYYTCSMHPQVMQDKPGNCPICGMKLVAVRQEAAPTGTPSPASASAEGRKVLYYWDPMMNPPYISDKPGKSPMGMDLVPVYEDEVRAGPTVIIDPVVTQNMGIRVAQVTRGPLATKVRTVGYLRVAEPNQHDVTLKVGGYVERLFAATEGMLVKQGQPLLDLYSPEVVVAEQELRAAKRNLDGLPPDATEDARAEAQALVDDTREKLELWGVAASDIDALTGAAKVPQTITFRSPATGYVSEKNVVEGASVAPGDRLFRIVDQSTLWLDAQIYESQLPLVKVGSTAVATVEGARKDNLRGQVIFMAPQVDPQTRATTARLSFPNPELALKPGMYATVEIEVDISPDAIQVPREAVIDTGQRQLVFVSLGGGRFDPREVRTGAETTEGVIEILEGLVPGEAVVTSGQFLLDTESHTREAIQKMTAERLLKPSGAAVPESGGAAPATEAAGMAGMAGMAGGGAAGDVSAAVDAVIKPYLEMAADLASDRLINASRIEALTKAAEALAAMESQGMLEPIATGLVENARALTGPGIEDQRKQFKSLSAYAVKLVDHVAPTTAVGPRLYVVHCPMFPGDWLQTSQPVRNPFYGKTMLECGTVQRTIEAIKSN
jgi:RND family efflux transporter MFP subunit